MLSELNIKLLVLLEPTEAIIAISDKNQNCKPSLNDWQSIIIEGALQSQRIKSFPAITQAHFSATCRAQIVRCLGVGPRALRILMLLEL